MIAVYWVKSRYYGHPATSHCFRAILSKATVQDQY